MIPKPNIHTLLMGDTGVGKDTFAARYPGNRLVWHMDGHGQEMPYFVGATQVGDILTYPLGQMEIKYRDVVMPDGTITRIEYYSSDNPKDAFASQLLEARMPMFVQEQDQWATLICGSLSSAALESRLHDQFVMNPQYKDPRKWYGAASHYVERLITWQKALTCNVVFICHIGAEKDELNGELVYTPDLPGKLSRNAARYFGEMYRLFVWRDEQGQGHRYLQTDNDGRYFSKTHINAPNPCEPTWEALWSGWRG